MGKYLTPERTLILHGEAKDEVLREMTRVLCRRDFSLDFDTVMGALKGREEILSSRIAPGIALPHALLPGYGKPTVALGYSPEGVPWDSPDGDPVHLVILSVCGRACGNEHVMMMADIADSLRGFSIPDGMAGATTAAEICEMFQKPAAKGRPDASPAAIDICRSMMKHAVSMAAETGARAAVIMADDMPDTALLGECGAEAPLIVVTGETETDIPELGESDRRLTVPLRGMERTHRVDLALMSAISEGLIDRHDSVVCLSGSANSDTMSVLEVIDMGREYDILFSFRSELEAGDISIHVFHRVLRIASSLAREGREGKPVGAIYVIGDYHDVQRRCYQMVINPFRGYPESERSVLDPGLEETIKEFSRVDGACLIRGDGVIMSLGSYISTEEAADALPSGLGARHAAAMAITMSTRAISLVISESTRRVSIFQKGRLVVALDRSA